jgi:four helix bundle protein
MLEGIRQLKAWELGHNLVLEIYRITKQFPREELFGLTSQMRRAAYSVPANIVEGSQSQYTKEYRQFLFTSKRSLAELEYFIILSEELGYLNQEEFRKLAELQQEAGRTLHGFIAWLDRQIQVGVVKTEDLRPSRQL